MKSMLGTDRLHAVRFTLAVAAALVAAAAGTAGAQGAHGEHELLYVRGNHEGTARPWEFEGEAGSLVMVEASADFDTTIALHSPDGRRTDFDDDGGPGLNSRLVSVLGADGRHRVEVGAVDDGGGPYTLTVRTLTAGSLSRDVPAGGVIGRDRRVGVWEFPGSSEELVTVEAGSEAFDTVLTLVSPAGEEIASDDDGGGGTDSRLVATLREDGLYRVLVAAFLDIGDGEYTVAVRPGTRVRQESTLLLARGAFTADRNQSEWTFDGTAGEVVTVAASAVPPGGGVDTVLALETPVDDEGNRVTIAWDDDSGEGIDSRLMAILPETGRYRIRVTNKSTVDNRGGAYAVEVRRAEVPLLVKGELTEGLLGGPGHGAGTWEFEGAAGEVVTVEAMSEDFDTVVELTSPNGETISVNDDGGEGTNSWLRASLSESGRHRIKVAAYRTGEGSYQVLVRSEERTRGEDLLVVRGVLADEPGVWGFEGAAGDVVVVEAASDAFDTRIELRAPCGRQLAADDDGGPGADSRVVATLRREEPCEERLYTVEVTSAGGTGAGPYTLGVRRAGRTAGEAIPALEIGVPAAGELGAGADATGTWTLDGIDAGTIVLDARSEHFDTVLTLTSPCGEPIARDDDGGAGLDSRIVATLPPADPECGEPYRVEVGAFGPGAAPAILPRPYTVTARLVEQRPRTLAVGASAAGELESAFGGVGVWELAGAAGRTVLIEAASAHFDPAVTLTSPCGERVAPVDDRSFRDDSRFMTSLPNDAPCSGPYRIIVTTLDDRSGQGQYRIEAREVRSLRVGGGGVRDDLSVGGTGIWEFEGRAQDRVAVEASSSSFDTVVALLAPSGERIATDDDGGGGTNSRLEATLPDSGRYRIEVTEYGADQALPRGGAAYSLAVRRAPTATLLFARGRLRGDAFDEGVWGFPGTRGQRVGIEASSDDFDPVVRLLRSRGDREVLPGAGSGGDSRLEATLPETGWYRVVVTANGAGGRTGGEYTLQVR